ncbi:hypothetical protein B0H16DRAFT_1895857 [Mycena metata]|uniref:Uncharacterized protein n=1 Tax=Mycena metata TaxID=1033252 RepID=A0AAD7HM68_9AGAR|nr:hypothetical protein B0H16DRAFT_1895857 [Mycena metata]
MTSESLNLNSLVSSLPAHSLNASSEKELLDNFKAAALSITTLYRSSRHASKRAYNAGYAAACRDLMEMLQLGVSDSHTLVPDRNQEAGMTIGRVMDWVEARLDAVRCREEEEDEEDERERGSHSSAPTTSGSNRPSPPARKVPVAITAALARDGRTILSSAPCDATQVNAQPPAAQAAPLNRRHSPVPPSDFHVPVPVSFPFLENVPPPVAGSKRRHAVMMLPPPTSSPQSTSSSSSSPLPARQPATTHAQHAWTRPVPAQSQPVGDSMMDVEEEGGGNGSASRVGSVRPAAVRLRRTTPDCLSLFLSSRSS